MNPCPLHWKGRVITADRQRSPSTSLFLHGNCILDTSQSIASTSLHQTALINHLAKQGLGRGRRVVCHGRSLWKLFVCNPLFPRTRRSTAAQTEWGPAKPTLCQEASPAPPEPSDQTEKPFKLAQLQVPPRAEALLALCLTLSPPKPAFTFSKILQR